VVAGTPLRRATPVALASRVVRVASLTEEDAVAWSNLRDRALEPYPFLDPRMIMASRPHMPLLRDMQLVFVEDGSQLVAVLPYVVSRMDGRPHLPILCTRTEYLDDQGGWDHPLVDGNRAQEAIEGLFDGLKSLGLPRLIQFTSVPIGGAFERALVAAAARKRIRLLEREGNEFVYARRLDDVTDADAPAIGVSNTPSFELPQLSTRLLKDLSRRADALNHHLGAPLRIYDRSSDPSAIFDFIELQAAGWKGDAARGGEGIRVRGDEAWFHDVTARYRADGDLVIFALVAGDTLLHMRVSTRIGGEVFGWFDAYDERFAEYRPGVLGRVASLGRILAVPGVQQFDPNFHPNTGPEPRKLFPLVRRRATILAANGGSIAPAYLAALPIARSVKRSIRSREQRR
jgi:hypothetical protein